MKPYLFLFNVASCLGWGYLVFLTFSNLSKGASATELWSKIGPVLKIVQGAAFLEILHVIIGFVKSPLGPTLMQVSSRLALLFATASSVQAQSHWSLYLMVGSWSLVEVPRYLFYALNLYMPAEKGGVPSLLFQLRYSLFAILYPTGITGELLQLYRSLYHFKTASPPIYYIIYFLLFVAYPLGGPFMYYHMILQRARAIANRKEATKPKPKLEGLLFPVSNPKTGERSTTEIGKTIFARSIQQQDSESAAKCQKERNWRFGYGKHVVKNVELSALSSTKAVAIARAGLEAAHELFEFKRGEVVTSLAQAMDGRYAESFHTGVIRGTKNRTVSTLEVPYKKQTLSGDALLQQLNKWCEYGTIEPSCRDHIANVVNHPEWLDLSDQYFVLLGAGSAMGPLLVLLSLGANVIAVDLDRAPIWKRLINLARDSPGSITFPLKKPQSSCSGDDDLFANAGCNLFTQTPEIRNWLLTVHPRNDLVIGGYAYLDGALHVQVSLAMDAIMKGVVEKRAAGTVALAFLCSPTDVFVQPSDAVEASKKNLKSAPVWQKILRLLTSRVLVKNTRTPVQSEEKDGGAVTIVDGLVIAQGPNYALAKRIQHWRAIVSRALGCVVSSNIAPSTATVSVVHNASFAAAYGGFHHFKPMEVFYQETSNAVMGALLIHDIRNKNGKAYPKTPLPNQVYQFSVGAFHGGIWRGAFKINSIGEVSAVAFYLKKYSVALSAIVVGVASGIGYLVKFGSPVPLP